MAPKHDKGGAVALTGPTTNNDDEGSLPSYTTVPPLFSPPASNGAPPTTTIINNAIIDGSNHTLPLEECVCPECGTTANNSDCASCATQYTQVETQAAVNQSLRSTPGAFRVYPGVPADRADGRHSPSPREAADNGDSPMAAVLPPAEDCDDDVDVEAAAAAANMVAVDEQLDRLGIHRVEAEAVPIEDADVATAPALNLDAATDSGNNQDDDDEENEVVNAMPISTIKCCFGKVELQASNMKWLVVVAVVSIIAIIVPVAIVMSSQDDNEQADPTVVDPNEPPFQLQPPVLKTLANERQVLKCGIYDRLGFSAMSNSTNTREGIEIDLCKAVAAAALGPSYQYETILTTATNRFTKLASGEIDVLISGTTHTFDRDVHQESAQMGFSFSTPYLYGGLTFNGVPEFVKCADEISVVGDCANLLICTQVGTTWMAKTEELFPSSNLVEIEEQSASIQSLIDGKCNVIQGEQYEAPEVVVRSFGYEGPYLQGKKSFTREPLAMVTRDGDPEFADFVEWTLQALMNAEVENITMETAEMFTNESTAFGDQFQNMFQNALAAVGNYGEMYDRHLEPISARLKVNKINDGDTGLLYSHPFGEVSTVGPGPIKGGVIENVLQRGFLRCGIPLIGQEEPSSDERVGLDIEFCRALSASILQRAPNITLESFSSDYENISQALENGDIDVFAGGEVDMNSDVRRPGLSFSTPYFYEAPSGNSTADGKAFSLVTKEGDGQWTNFVYWVTMATIYAEENGVTSATSNEMPLVSLFGADLERLLRDTVVAVGNYGDMYRRVFGQNATRVGRNMLNDSPFDQQHNPLSFGNHYV